MDTNAYKEFLILAETCSYAEAAEQLFMNQSTLSKHIQAMEKELGVPLFYRTTRRVTLTEYGELMLDYAKQIVHLQFEYSTAILQRKHMQKNTLTIGCIPSMPRYGIMQQILDFQNLHPDIQVKFLEGDSSDLLQWLRQGICDLAICRQTLPISAQDSDTWDSIEYHILAEDQLVAVTKPDHPLAGLDRCTLKDLADEKICLLKEGTTLYDQCVKAFRAADFTPNILFDSHQVNNILEMVASSDCTALLMRGHVNDERFHLTEITPAVNSNITLCYRRGNTFSSFGKKLICRVLQDPDR